MIKGEVLKAKDIKNLQKAGTGGQGTLLILNEEFVIKKYVNVKKDIDRFPGKEMTIT